jgi:hypothetical protein
MLPAEWIAALPASAYDELWRRIAAKDESVIGRRE